MRPAHDRELGQGGGKEYFGEEVALHPARKCVPIGGGRDCEAIGVSFSRYDRICNISFSYNMKDLLRRCV